MGAASKRLRLGVPKACLGGSAGLVVEHLLRDGAVALLYGSGSREEVLGTCGHDNVERPAPDRMAVSGYVRIRDARCWGVCETQGDAMGTMVSHQDRRLGA